MAKGAETRKRILDIAEEAVLSKGFAGTSIEEIIVEAGLTKSGFLYHFKDKGALAGALLDRYVVTDDRLLDEVFDRAGELTDDPLQRMLVGLKMLAEIFYDLPNGHPGCMVAAVCYSERLFDRQIGEKNRLAVLAWRARFRGMLEEVSALYPTRDDIELDDVADMFSVIADGGIIVSKVLHEPALLGNQVLLYRSYIKLLFSPDRAA